MTVVETGPPAPKHVFIIHGHDAEQKHGLKRLLKQAGVEPVLLQDEIGANAAFIEKFEFEAAKCVYAVAILTPDDLMHRHRSDGGLAFHPRQNVVFEIGWFAGRLGRQRVLMLHKGKNVDIPSDLLGVEHLTFELSVDECADRMLRHLKSFGII